jgi:endonuclease G, mitochondrial
MYTNMDLHAKVRRANDYFLISNGIPTPEYFWKVILSADKAIAWYIPNRSDLASLDSYLVSIADLEAKLGVAMVGIDALESLKASRAEWAQLAGCSLS